MMRPGRIWSIYRKELLEILRDRRTLTAMVVIPVVLYPVLMLGFLRAAEGEQARLQSRQYTVETQSPAMATELQAMVSAVREHQQTATADPPSPAGQATFDIRPGSTPDAQLGDDVQLRVTLEAATADQRETTALKVHITYNEVNINSRAAMEQMREVLRVFRDLAVRQRLADLLGVRTGEPAGSVTVESILEPVQVKTVSMATDRQRGGWALGQIIPIILILMTITGSVYPAIDLTAGERERGTLETLMVTPVPSLYLILGKFLVVASVGILTAALNVASVGATMHFSGITRTITEQMPVEIPLSVLPMVLLCMVPFALLFAAILVAVCSFARTFKEAQSYIMPVMLAALIPAIAVTLPTVRLAGIMLVLPVGNMVLLTRDLFQQTATASQVIIVLASTTLYAIAAVAVAVRLFGQEAVVFADAGSYKTLLLRRYYRPSSRPTVSQALLTAALLFPASFYAQSLLGAASGDDFRRTLVWLAFVQFAGLFMLLPLALCLYYRIDVPRTFRLNLGVPRAWLAAVLMGSTSWLLAQEFVALQSRLIPQSEAMQEALKQIESQLAAAPLWQIVLLMAVVPAIAEEFFFRGFVLSGLSQSLHKWSAILLTAAVFGAYHFMIDRVPVTALVGVALAYTAWQTRALAPCIIFHMLHNGLLMILSTASPELVQQVGLPTTPGALLPAKLLIPAMVIFAAGVTLIPRSQPSMSKGL